MPDLTYDAGQLRPFCRKIVLNGQHVQSRQNGTTEMMFASFEVQPNVLNACPVRKFNLGFAFAEFASLVTGYDKLSLFTRHMAHYTMFSTDGVFLDNSYGSRIADHIENLIDLLKRSPDARQAVLTINDTKLHMLTTSNHHPCTLSIQFLVRRDKLHMQVNMRSNDAIKGVTTDCVVFRLLQLYIARRLDMPAGEYVQTAGSLHVYDSDRDMINGLPERSQSYAMNWSMFDYVDHEALLNFALAMDSDDVKSGYGWSYLPPGLSDMYLAAGYRWHGDDSQVGDYLLRSYLRDRYPGKAS